MRIFCVNYKEMDEIARKIKLVFPELKIKLEWDTPVEDTVTMILDELTEDDEAFVRLMI